jgi:hypothetical protein
MSRRPLLALAPVLVASALGLAAWSAHRDAPRATSSVAAAAALPATAVGARPAAAEARRSRYRLSWEQHAFAGGREQAAVILDGLWTTTERAGAPSSAQLAATRIVGRGAAAPSAADLAAPVALGATDGVLDAMGFDAETPRAARALLTSLATALQHTDRPGPSWSVEEEDVLGRYVASYTRAAGGRVVRTRDRYTHLRGGAGLTAERAPGLSPVERSELRFDADGLASAHVTVRHAFSLGEGMPAVELTLVATLEREDVATVALPPAAGPDLSPLSDHADRAGITRLRDEARVAGAKAPELLAEARRVAHLDARPADGQRHRSVIVKRLAALARLDGGAAAAIAEGIRREPADLAAVSLLAGSLASANAPAATNALAGLLDDALPADTRGAVLVNLGLARVATGESVAALTSALDAPQGATAALALGTQAGKLGEDGAGTEAVDQLLARLAAATSDDERGLYLEALANTGSRQALPALQAALQDPSFALARLGAYGLRFIPGDDVDDLLLALLQGGSVVTVEAVKATAYRSAALWQPRLEAARAQFAGEKRVLDTIAAVLGRWAAPAPAQPE